MIHISPLISLIYIEKGNEHYQVSLVTYHYI